MNGIARTAILSLALVGATHFTFAQGTFTTIYSILQSRCTGSACHGAGSALTFDVDGTEGDLYSQLVGSDPTNPAAADKKYKLVDPGYPYNSFLLRKVGGELDSYLAMTQQEGDMMPKGQAALADHEVELIRQWILMGAPRNGNVVDYQLLQDYYAIGGFSFLPVPDAPDPSEGMQIRYGPIFLAPGAEVEWDKKENLRNEEQIKVYRTDGYMPWQSHHMLLFKFNGDGSGVREGMRLVPSEAFPFNGDAALTGAWQNDADFELPDGTAFFWGPETVLDFDYHIKNYSQTEILPADFYLNIYYDNSGDRDIRMFAQLDNNVALILTQGDQTRTYTSSFNEDRYIYMMSSHVHQWGTDFDIYLRNSNGNRGEKIYEGFYNEDYSFNQGYYDWEHPPIRYFSPLQKASHGLDFEARWNVGVPFVTFGLTADDEMMLITYLYTKQELPVTTTGIVEQGSSGSMEVHPNPFNLNTEIVFDLPDQGVLEVEVHNLLGQKVTTLTGESTTVGKHTYRLNAKDLGKPGIYFVSAYVDGLKVSTKKVTLL